MQHDYRYVTRREANAVKNELIEILNEVQDIVRSDFTFKYWFIGSSSRNMITYDAKGNQGYDFDVNIEINDEDEEFPPAKIKCRIRLAFDQVVGHYGYNNCEDSTRVLTFKFKDIKNSRILHSCDVGIVHNYIDDYGEKKQQYIHYNKQQNSYSWNYQPKGFFKLEEKYAWIKSSGFAEELREYYLYKKNNNDDPDKHSRSIFAETVHEICMKNGYKTDESDI